MNKGILLIASSLLLSGCEAGTVVLTDAQRAEVQATTLRRGVARHEMFVECMKLAATMPRQADDDVADIVDECESASYYMTNYIE